jgi:hypothetical protein
VKGASSGNPYPTLDSIPQSVYDMLKHQRQLKLKGILARQQVEIKAMKPSGHVVDYDLKGAGPSLEGRPEEDQEKKTRIQRAAIGNIKGFGKGILRKVGNKVFGANSTTPANGAEQSAVGPNVDNPNIVRYDVTVETRGPNGEISGGGLPKTVKTLDLLPKNIQKLLDSPIKGTTVNIVAVTKAGKRFPYKYKASENNEYEDAENPPTNEHANLFNDVKSRVAPKSRLTIEDYIIDALSDDQRKKDFGYDPDRYFAISDYVKDAMYDEYQIEEFFKLEAPVEGDDAE